MRPTDLNDFPCILTMDDIAAVFGISRCTAANLMNEHGFPSFKIGRRWYVFRDTLKEWMSKDHHA